jgi:hypothetical protein
MIRVEGDEMPRWFPDTEKFVIDGWHGLNGRRGKPQRDEALMSCMKILDHEVKRRVVRNNLLLRDEDQMRSPSQLEDRHIRPLIYGPHPDRAHELGGLFQSISLEDDVPNPDRRPQIFTHDFEQSPFGVQSGAGVVGGPNAGVQVLSCLA